MNLSQKLALEADATSRVDAPADGRTESQNKETRRAVQFAVIPPAAEVGLVKSVYVGAVPAVKSVEKTVVAPAPTATAPGQGAGQVTATVTTVANNPNTVVVSKPVYPRWYFRKRFWNVPRKTVYVAPAATADTLSSPSDVVGGLFFSAVGDGGGTVAAGKTYTSGSLFDDIFNIPISTLSAVNQLLKNNVG